jgi:hypothetical protein
MNSPAGSLVVARFKPLKAGSRYETWYDLPGSDFLGWRLIGCIGNPRHYAWCRLYDIAFILCVGSGRRRPLLFPYLCAGLIRL